MKKTLFVSALLVALAGVGAAGTVRLSEDTYPQLRVYTQAVSLVENDYVDPIPLDRLIDDGVAGLLRKLDGDSAHLSAADYRALRESGGDHQQGIGLVVGRKKDALTVVAPLDGSPAERAGVRPGDRVVKIDGAIALDMSPAEAARKMRGAPGSRLTLTLAREGWMETREFQIQRAPSTDPGVVVREVGDGVAFVRIPRFSPNAARDVAAGLARLPGKSPRGIVLDVRNAAGGSIPAGIDVAGAFLDDGAVVAQARGRAQTENRTFRGSARSRIPGIPVVVLANEGTAGAGEIVAGALADAHRAVVVGAPTFGRAREQSIVPLSDGSALLLTTARYLRPNGQPIDGEGIAPDIEVAAPTLPVQEFGDAAKDPQLQRALDVIKVAHIVETHEAGRVGLR